MFVPSPQKNNKIKNKTFEGKLLNIVDVSNFLSGLICFPVAAAAFICYDA